MGTMRLKWENVTVECQSYKLEILGLCYYLEYDLGRKQWNLRQVLPGLANFDHQVSSIEEAEDMVLEQLRKRKPVVEKELEIVNKWLGSSTGRAAD